MKKKDTKKQAIAIRKAALKYIQRGYYVVPIPPGKNHPTDKDWQDLRVKKSGVKGVFANASGIGLLLKPSKLTDVDIDCPEAAAAGEILLPTTEMVHGRHGNPSSHHYYYSSPALHNKSFADPRRPQGAKHVTLIEIRTNGQTVAPPSFHWKTGERIAWDSQGKPKSIEGKKLYRRVAKVASAALLARYWPDGSRHFAALALAGMLLRAGWTEEPTRQFILAVATAAGDEEAKSRVKNVVSTAQKLAEQQQVTGTPRLAELVGDDIVGKVREWLELKVENEESSPHHTDLGNARRLVACFGKKLHFCHESGKWLTWNGKIWATDNSGLVNRLAKDAVRTIYLEAGVASDPDRSLLAKHALKSEAEARLCAMVSLAKTEPGIPVSPSELDADSWALNCNNGVVDLRTGKLRPHHPDNLCTKQVRVAFDPAAKCPGWLAFLNRVMGGKKGLVKFLQRTVGYSLTGSIREEVLFFLYGTGANGKSTFIETCRNLLCDYAQQADFDTFVTKKNDGPRNDLARLRGARSVSAVEAAQGRQLAENVIKQVTGGDMITARFLYHEHFEYLPQFKLFLVANHKPRIVGTDEAIWRRIRLIPFTVTIPSAERDKQLLEKLQGELAGILAWAVRGCLEWQSCGLGEPLEVSEATAAYRHEMDTLADFVDDRCIVGEGAAVAAGLLYEAFKMWCENNGEELLTQKTFGVQLRERGFQPCKRHGQRCWRGLRLRREDDN